MVDGDCDGEVRVCFKLFLFVVNSLILILLILLVHMSAGYNISSMPYTYGLYPMYPLYPIFY